MGAEEPRPTDLRALEDPPEGVEYWQKKFRRLSERSGPSESLGAISSNLGLDRPRSFVLSSTGPRTLGRRPALTIYDPDLRPLFAVVRDPEKEAEVARWLGGRRFADPPSRSGGEPEFRVRADTFAVATPTEVGGLHLAFIHYDRLSTSSYVPSPWDCFLLVDRRGVPVVYAPVRRTDTEPPKAAMDQLFLPSGELVQTSDRDPGGRGRRFLDTSGRVLATITNIGDDAPLPTKHGGLFQVAPDAIAAGPLFHLFFILLRSSRAEAARSG